LILVKGKKQQRYVNIFDELSEDWESIVQSRHTEKETNFINEILPKKGVILDLCCGTARHSILLNKKERRIIGLDLSKNLLLIAKQNMRDAGADFPLVRADMRSFPFRDQIFYGVICMFTSFGYLPSENEDKKSLNEVWRTLQKNGKFLLDVSNRFHLIKTYQEKEWAEFEPFYLLEKRALNLKQDKLKSEWTIIRKSNGEIRKIQHNLRLYTFLKMKKLLRKAGLTIRNVYGGYETQSFSNEGIRMIVLAEKAG
jgi:ubiquinone/menaquinone biosynthesis C-methylase UbiE